MSRATNTKNAIAEAWTDRASYAALHTGDPGETGANELTSAGRQPLVWGAPSGGVMTSQSVTFSVPAGAELTHVGFWTAGSGGEYVDSCLNIVTYETAGDYTVTLTFAA